MNADTLILLAYAASNALRLASYAPQIWRVARDHSGAQAISCLTWNLWIVANATTALYAWTHLHDLALTVTNAGNALCCAAVVLITLGKRAALNPDLQEATMKPTPNCCSIFSKRAAAPLAVGLCAALTAALVMTLQGALDAAHAPSLVSPGASDAPTPTVRVEPPPALDGGIDWQRVEVAPAVAGASIAAYE